MWLMLATLPHVAQAGISDEELRRLFIVTGQEATPYQYGGVVLFKSYFEANGTACGFKQRYPDTTVFVDQEGGKVVRIAGAAPPSPEASRGMTDQHFYDQVVQSAKKLKAACVDVNLARRCCINHPEAELPQTSDGFTQQRPSGVCPER